MKYFLRNRKYIRVTERQKDRQIDNQTAELMRYTVVWATIVPHGFCERKLLMSARSAHLSIRSVEYNQGFWIYLYDAYTLG